MYHFRFLIVPFFFFSNIESGSFIFQFQFYFWREKKKEKYYAPNQKKGTKIREFLFCHRFRHARVQWFHNPSLIFNKVVTRWILNAIQTERFLNCSNSSILSKEKIYIYIYLIPNSRCLLFPSSSSSSVTFESPIRNRVERVLRYLDASPSPPLLDCLARFRPPSLDFVILIFALFTVSPSCIYPRCERHDDCGRIIL